MRLTQTGVGHLQVLEGPGTGVSVDGVTCSDDAAVFSITAVDAETRQRL